MKPSEDSRYLFHLQYLIGTMFQAMKAQLCTPDLLVQVCNQQQTVAKHNHTNLQAHMHIKPMGYD